jgi:hypothetical protein
LTRRAVLKQEVRLRRELEQPQRGFAASGQQTSVPGFPPFERLARVRSASRATSQPSRRGSWSVGWPAATGRQCLRSAVAVAAGEGAGGRPQSLPTQGAPSRSSLGTSQAVAEAQAVLPNPSLESRPSEAGHLGPGGVRLRYIGAARAKAPCLSGPAQLER